MTINVNRGDRVEAVFVDCPREFAEHRQIVGSQNSKSISAVDHWRCFDVDLPTCLEQIQSMFWYGFPAGVVVMEVRLRPLTGMVSNSIRESYPGEIQKVAPESVTIDQMTDLGRKSVEEASIGCFLGNRKDSRKRTRCRLG